MYHEAEIKMENGTVYTASGTLDECISFCEEAREWAGVQSVQITVRENNEEDETDA